MQSTMKSPATAANGAGLSIIQLGGNGPLQVSPALNISQGLRALEAEAVQRLKSALLLRGGDRLQALAVAGVYSRAARSAALRSGGVQ